VDGCEELFEVVKRLEGAGFEFAGGKVIADGAAGAEGDTIGGARAGEDAGGVDLAEVAEGNDFVEEVKVFAGLAFVHAALFHIRLSADGHA